MSSTDSFDELVSGVESEIRQALIEKRGAVAVMLARITGVVYSEAMAAGVPHALAQEMAGEFWATEMAPAPQTEVVVDDDGGLND